MVSSRKIFPSLQTIAVYDQFKPNLPMDDSMAPRKHREAYSYLLAWTKRYREMGIALVGVNDEPMAHEDPGPERWRGRIATTDDSDGSYDDVHTDPEDLSFPSDSDEISDGDESSEYSSSDLDSDDGDWDPELSGSEVGSTEALEIFRSTVEVCSFVLC